MNAHSETVAAEPADVLPPGAFYVKGKPVMTNAKGDHVPLSKVSATDLLIDETVRKMMGLTRALQIGAGLLAALGAAVMLRRARQQGWQDREAKLSRDTAEAVAKYQDKKDEVAALSGADLDRRARRWVRDDEAR